MRTRDETLRRVHEMLCEIRDLEPVPDALAGGRLNYAGALGRCEGIAENAASLLAEYLENADKLAVR